MPRYSMYYSIVLCMCLSITGLCYEGDILLPIPAKVKCDSTYALRSTINPQNNVIQDKHNTLEPIIKQLKECRQGANRVVSVLHIGDSHIQAGFLSAKLRLFFQHNFSDAGRGMITPLRMAGTNEPSDYEIRSPNIWTGSKSIDRGLTEKTGLTGLNITTQQKNIELDISAKSEFCVVRAFHHANAPMLIEPEELSIGSYCPDQNTPNSTKIVLNHNVTSVKMKATLTDDYNVGTFYGFSLENGKPGVLYHSVGMNGMAFSYYNNHTMLAQQSALLEPKLIIISLGTNDSYGTNFNAKAVYSHVDRMIMELQKENPMAAIILTTPVQNCRKTYVEGAVQHVINDNNKAMAKIIVAVAKSHQIAYWDLFSICGGEQGFEIWLKYGLFQKDMVHLTKEGYDFMAAMFAEAFVSHYNSLI